MGQSSNGLHFDHIAAVQSSTQQTRGINHLPLEVLVVHVTHKQTLCGERIRLYVNVGTRDRVNEATLADVRVTAEDESTRVRIDARQTREMLTYHLQVAQTGVLLLEQSTHATESGTLQLFAAERCVSVLQETNKVLGQIVDQTTSHAQLCESTLVLVTIIENIAKVCVEGMNRVDVRKLGQNRSQLVVNRLRSVLDLALVERTNTSNVELGMYNSRSLTLCTTQDDINHFLAIWHHSDALPVVDHHDDREKPKKKK
mmetsp:Transcript_41582/g.104859  ORF Transcript_41582/g.104859 Transcript_41582/m.104859 type:complete len:257 (-) Transcript_41582:199-969(-)